ncbi:MAG TPA: hypothetical protein VLQ29_04190 [Candidatus Dormibacteraeota bacterium]|nr:hypothetical protein [Candidatus Dormibacteraeota bacterium]
MNWFVSALITGALAFSATNIDDIVFLTIFFSQASHRWQVVIGQYLGFTALVLVRSVKKTLIRLLLGSGAEQDHAKRLNRSMQKLISSVLLLIGIVIALGGFEHSLGAGGRVEAALVAHAVPGEINKLVLVVWHFAGGCLAGWTS